MSSSKSKQSQTTTNPYAIQAYNNAQSALGNSQYKALTGDQINSYMSPYLSNVADTTIAGLNKSRQMALNSNSDAATRASAFGGSRHGVADALTNSEYDQNTASVLANLYNTGYGQAANMAQTENAAANQYPILIQQLLGQLAGGTQTNTSGTSSSRSMDLGSILQGAGSAAQGFAMLSDARLKTDIQPLGKRNGRNWYSYRYLWSDERHEGVMAQENPDIAFDIGGGILAVDYGAL